MDQQFENEVMQDLAGKAPPSSAEEAFEESADMGDDAFEDEDYLQEDAMAEGLEGMNAAEGDAFLAEESLMAGFEDDLGEELAEGSSETWDALEEVMADALTAEDSDAFLRTVLGGISRVAGITQRGATAVSQTARRAAGAVAEGAGRVSVAAGRAGREAEQARSAPNPLVFILQRLRQHQRQGFEEGDAFEDLADVFAHGDMDEALPVLAGMAARAVVRPALRRATGQLSPPIRRQLVRSATQAAQTLARRQGHQALQALPRIAQSVGRAAARRRLRPGALPQALSRTAAQVATRPSLVRRLLRPTMSMGTCPFCQRVSAGRRPQRMVVQGPVEIAIIPR